MTTPENLKRAVRNAMIAAFEVQETTLNSIGHGDIHRIKIDGMWDIDKIAETIADAAAVEHSNRTDELPKLIKCVRLPNGGVKTYVGPSELLFTAFEEHYGTASGHLITMTMLAKQFQFEGEYGDGSHIASGRPRRAPTAT